MMLLKQPMSLLDQKKMQWAKEKEELNGLWSPWGRPSGQTPGFIQDDRNKRRTSGPLITLSTVSKLCTLASGGAHSHSQSEYHLPPIIQPGNQQSPPNTADDCAYCNPGLIKRKSSLPASMESTNAGEMYERQKSYAELTEHHARKGSILKQTQRDRYDEHNFTSGYQSEVFGEEFGSRNGSGDSHRLTPNHAKEYYSLPRPSHGQNGGHVKEKSNENDSSFSRYSKETDRRHSYSNNNLNQPVYGTWHSTTSVNAQTLPSAMRSSFTNAIDAADSNAFRDIQQREKEEWLHELEKQRDEQRRRKLLEKEETRPKWGDRGVVVGHLWEPSEVATARLPQQREDNGNYSQYPGWVEKSPNRLSTAGSENPETSAYPIHSFDILVDHHQQPETTNSEKTFIRGQNVPIDPDVFAEREKKRMAALKHQEEIRKQMEERQMQLKIDREKRLAEERLDEERIANQRREELRRLDIEKRQLTIAQEEKELEPETKYDPMTEYQRKKSILDKIHKRKPPSPEHDPAPRPQKSAEAILQQEDRFEDLEDTIIIERRRNSLTLPAIPTQDDWKQFPEFGPRLSPANLNRSPVEEILRSRSLTRESTATQTDETRILEDVVKTSVKSKSTTNLVHPPADPAPKKKERPRWGVVPPKVQYVKQSEKDPNFHLKQKRKDRMKRREQQLQHAAVVDTESEDGRHPVGAAAKGARQPLKANHTANANSNTKTAEQISEELCQKEATYYTTTIRPAATYRQRNESMSTNKNQNLTHNSVSTSKYQHLTQQERLLLQAYENEESAAESSQFSSSPASYEKELDFHRSVLITDEEIRLSRSLTRKRTTVNVNQSQNQRKTSTVSQQQVATEQHFETQTQISEPQRQAPEIQVENPETTPPKASEPPPQPKNAKIVQKAVVKPNAKLNDANKKKLTLPSKKIEAVLAFQYPRTDSPPVPAVLKKIQEQAQSQKPEVEKVDKKPDPEPLSPPLPDFIKKLDDDDADSFLSSESTSEDLEISKVQEVSTTKRRVRSNKSKISSNTHILDMPLSDYEKIPHVSDVSPRYMTKINNGQTPRSRPGANEKQLISYVMQNEEVQAQMSAREIELSSKGIIEFSIKLPAGQTKGSKVTGVQGKKGVGKQKEKEEAYMDPLESARRRATINWVNSKENGNKGILSHLSQLKQGIKQQQYQWGVVPVDSAEDELHSLKNYPH